MPHRHITKSPNRSIRATVERFQMALDLWITGVTLQRQRLRRVHPHLSDAEIDALVDRWLQERPGAEAGDGPPPASR